MVSELMEENENNKTIKKVKNKKKRLSSFLLNITILAVAIIYGWMLTDPSFGEMLEYTGHFVITDSNVTVRLFVLQDNSYNEQSQLKDDPLIELPMMQPSSMQKYRMDITNNHEVFAATKIVLANLSGNIDELKDYIYIGCNNPKIFKYKLADILKIDEATGTYYVEFMDYYKVEAYSTQSIYWNISIDPEVGNEIQNMTFSIGNIMFLNP